MILKAALGQFPKEALKRLIKVCKEEPKRVLFSGKLANVDDCY